MLQKFYRAKAVCERLSVSKSWLYDAMANDKFPRPNVNIGKRSRAWTEDVIEKAQADMIAAATTEAE
jgi:predicted DNA-binding transcriptional regulator AlpA